MQLLITHSCACDNINAPAWTQCHHRGKTLAFLQHIYECGLMTAAQPDEALTSQRQT